MSYRENLVEENNQLRAELAEQKIEIDAANRSRSYWRTQTAIWGVAAWVALAVILVLVIGMTVRAPLSANTRGAAEEFCDALEKQAREEEQERAQR